MGKVLLIVVLVLLVLAVAQMMRVYELSSKVRGRKEPTITRRENNMNAVLMLVFCIAFFGFVIWQMVAYGMGGKGPSVSIHGEATDWLIGLNFGIIIPVFFLCNALLFYFAFKFAYKKDRDVYYLTHNNKLEMMWTVAPAIVLAIIIVLGLRTWNDITDMSGDYVVHEHTGLVVNDGKVESNFEFKAAYQTVEEAGVGLSNLSGSSKLVLVEKGGEWVLQTYEMDGESALIITEQKKFNSRNSALLSLVDEEVSMFTELKEQKLIEIYSKQFDWTTRYAGKDNALGDANFKLIDYNSWGDTNTFLNPLGLISSETIELHFNRIDARVSYLNEFLGSAEAAFETDEKLAEMTEEMERLKRKKMRVQSTIANDMGLNAMNQSEVNSRVYDDVILKGDIHLVVGQPYQFQFKSQDVIHSAYFPHFRAQMNCVPGMATQIKFTPTMTTKEFREHPDVIAKYEAINKAREKVGKPLVEASFLLLCNKICGLSHSNMWVNVIVETQEEYEAWMADQKTFEQQLQASNLK
ncbi:hypothetical protein OAW23_01715 [Flavobacteriales bacterium]|nr:hypothetical protein [Flavobacteriales bacterium]